MEQLPQQPEKAPEAVPGSAPQQENLLDEIYEDSMEGYDKPIRKARILLFVIAALQLIALFTVTGLPEPENWITMGIYVFFAGVFAVLALWTKKKPFTAIVTALTIYSALILLSAILEPSSIIRGIVLKIIAIVLMVGALKNAKEVQNWMENRDRR
jgi:prepilin signal peptidase PulO-like enzyme (type II secretory pathway)